MLQMARGIRSLAREVLNLARATKSQPREASACKIQDLTPPRVAPLRVCTQDLTPVRAKKKLLWCSGAFFLAVSGGVANGTRTHDNQNHNLGLYQLSYSHHRNQRL